ncbi:hypothetical protein MTR67_040400 [Solanum verrucosum]|uniref:Serine hydroxymethyltransferase-like domain-containing protein n=1 Tax=Solanum verrucosum TaxID=315347 RepID=A0AAF0ZRM7_SOLVR|nr:hypothetical protein MTR67_040400 [Solanum verrucosum]
MQKQDLSFSSRSVPDTIYACNESDFSVIWLPVNSQWKILRKIMNSHIFSGHNLDVSKHLRSEKVQELIDYCDKSGKNCEAVNIGRAAFRTSINFLSNTIFSKDLTDPSFDSAKEIKDLVWNIMVEAGQEQCLPGFLLSKLGELGKAEKIQGLLEAFAARYSERFPNILVNKDDVLLFAMFGVHVSKPSSSYLVFDPGLYLDDDSVVFGVVEMKAVISWKVDASTGYIDCTQLENYATLFRPKFIVTNTSAYAHCYDYARLRKFLFATTCGMHATNIVLDSNLEDKVLIEDGSIVMNQPRPNVNTYTDATQLVIGPKRSSKIRRPSQRRIDPQGRRRRMTNHFTKVLTQDMFVAGSDTTSNTLEWAMAELLKNPHTLEKAQEELAQVIGRGKLIDEADVAKLSYLRCVVKETFRIHPPAPFLIPRKAVEDVEFCGYIIPKDSQVLVNIWAIRHDSSLWEDPLDFKPERFWESDIDVRGQNFELIPFGAGRRICPGLPLAIKMVPVTLGSILNTFNWKLHGGIAPKDLDMEEKFGITLGKAQPLLAIPVPL